MVHRLGDLGMLARLKSRAALRTGHAATGDVPSENESNHSHITPRERIRTVAAFPQEAKEAGKAILAIPRSAAECMCCSRLLDGNDRRSGTHTPVHRIDPAGPAANDVEAPSLWRSPPPFHVGLNSRHVAANRLYEQLDHLLIKRCPHLNRFPLSADAGMRIDAAKALYNCAHAF